jgi:hypothetical protein
LCTCSRTSQISVQAKFGSWVAKTVDSFKRGFEAGRVKGIDIKLKTKTNKGFLRVFSLYFKRHYIVFENVVGGFRC